MQRNMWAINSASRVLEQNSTAGANNNSNDASFGWGRS